MPDDDVAAGAPPTASAATLGVAADALDAMDDPTFDREDDPTFDREVAAASEGIVPGAAAPSATPAKASPAKIEVICQSLRTCKLSYLRLERMDLGDDGAVALANELGKGVADAYLKALYLGDNGIGDDGAAEIARGLQARPPCKLKKLFLQQNLQITIIGHRLLQAVCKARNVELIMEPREKRPQPPRRRPASPPPPRSPSPPPRVPSP